MFNARTRFRRLLCLLLGCKPPTAAFDRRGRMCIFCPRCGLVTLGKDVAAEMMRAER